MAEVTFSNRRRSVITFIMDRSIQPLSPREQDCLRLVAEHKRTAQIAFELGLKPGTVDSYIASACRKLDVNDRDSAVRVLIDRGEAPWISRSGFPGLEGVALDAFPWWTRLPWPFPTKGRPDNDLNLAELLVSIVGTAAFLMIVAAVYFFAIATLSRAF